MHSLKALRHGSHSFTCKLHHACLSFVSVHQMAPPLTEVADIQLQLITHLSTPKGWKAKLAWLVDLSRTVYPHKWSTVSYRSSAGQGKVRWQDRHSTTVPCNQHSQVLKCHLAVKWMITILSYPSHSDNSRIIKQRHRVMNSFIWRLHISWFTVVALATPGHKHHGRLGG